MSTKSEASIVVSFLAVGDMRPEAFGRSAPHQGVRLEAGHHRFEIQLGEEEMRKIAKCVGRTGRLILQFDD